MGVIKTADKKPEIYTKPDGKRGVRMVPVDKQIVKTETAMNMRNAKLINKIKKSGVAKQGSMKDEDQIYDKKAVAKKGYDEVDELSMSLKDLTKSGVNKKGYGDKDKLKRDLAALKKKLATESYSMKEMCCKNCGDTFGNPTEGNCMYDAYDKNGKNWVTKKEYLAAQKKNEEVELDENYRQLATKGMGTEYHPKHKFGDTTKVGRGVDYYHPKTGAKGDGKIVKTTDTHYHVKDTKSGQVHKFAYLDKEKAKKLMGESVELEEGPFKGIGKQIMRAKIAGKRFGTHLKKMRALDKETSHSNKHGDYKDSPTYQKKAKELDKAYWKLSKKQNKLGNVQDRLGKKPGKRDYDKWDYKKDLNKRKLLNKEEVKLDEVLDRPGALDSYRKKADDSGNRARNSATRKILTAPKDGKRPDHSDELNTMRKRNKGQDMADRVAARQFRKSIGLGYNAKKEEVEEKKLTPKEVKRALASIKPPKKKPTLPKAPWDKKEEGYVSHAQRKAVWAARNDKKQQNESVDLSEKLNVSQGMGAWVDDFKKSDAPQFKGKSDKERRDMAIAAYLSAKRGDK